MVETENVKESNPSADEAPPLNATSKREEFFKWLSDGNAKKYSPSVCMNCLDRISEYAIQKKIISINIWNITQRSVFQPIYNRLLEAKLLRITEKNTYKIFIVVGQLYLRFLKEKPWLKVADKLAVSAPIDDGVVTDILESDVTQTTAESVANVNENVLLCCPYKSDINPEDVIAWLMTQKNARGTLYLENVARSYMSTLHSAPFKLTLSLPLENRNVFSCHTVAELDALWNIFKAAPNYIEVNRYLGHGQLSAGLTVYRRYLEHLERDGTNEATYNISELQKQTVTAPSEIESSEGSPLYVDFNRPEACAQTRPLTCTIKGQVVKLSKLNWSHLLVAITEMFIAENNPNLASLEHEPIYGSKVFFMPEKVDFGTCALLSNGKWLYTNYNPQTVVTIIGNLCRHCGIDINDVSITYLPKTGYVPEAYEQIVVHNTPKEDEAVQTVIMDILDKNFPNGIRPNSIIDSNKLKNYYAEATGKDISGVVPDIPSVLEVVGVKHGDKVYAVSASGKKILAELFDRLLSEGNRLFYYDEFYDAHADFLQGMHVFSSELLKTILSEINPSLWYYKNYCQTDRSTTVESEILRCYETAVTLSYDQLKARLPYVPLASIRQALAQNNDFIWVNTGIYTHVRKIEFDKSEVHEVCSKIEEAVSAHGFASLASINVWASVELNPELSETAIRNGLFQVYLSDRYEKRGNIVTMKGTVLNSVAVFEDFCRSHDRLTLDELLNYEKEINGDVHSQSLFVAYDNMVRVDRDAFVADSEIQFDVDATDNALALFVHGDVIPLRAVTSFTSFPYIDGYPWNWFLLESFCRRFSKRFRFQCLSVSSRNVGAIYKKSAGFANYAEIIAAAVAVEPIKLNQKEVGDFLFKSGYIARRTSFVADVVAQARLLRERRG